MERPKLPTPSPRPTRTGRQISGTVAIGFGSRSEREAALEAELRTQRDRHRRLVEATACAAHELRGQLHNAKGWLHVVREDVGTPHRGIAIIERAIDAQERLLDDLVDATRLESGHRLSLTVEKVDLEEVVRGAFDSIALAAERKRIALVVSTRSIVVDGDPHRLGQALVNVLSNAVKFSDAEATVTVLLEDVGDEAILSVADTGRGIANEHLAAIFEIFHRVDDRVAGVGVGLPVARAIADLHGGTLEVESELGVGTTVRIRLPIVS